MLRLSKKADYALIAMNHLARKQGSPSASTSARDIAERYDIPIELMAKVLQRLVRTGLLVSTQGTRGGYMLSRPSGSISVADVIQAIDGPFTVTACSTDKARLRAVQQVQRAWPAVADSRTDCRDARDGEHRGDGCGE